MCKPIPHPNRFHIRALGAAVLVGFALSACGGSGKHAANDVASTSASTGSVVAQVGDTSITRGSYEHWMKVGDATVNIPVPGRPPPRPVAYEPPSFAACIANLKESVAKPHATKAQLKAKCRQTYTNIQARVLNFLITGYWLRNEAAEQGVSVSEAEVRKRFEQEKRRSYPTAASFGKFQEASLQTVPDLMFAVETQMLSAKLLERFTGTNGGRYKAEQAKISAFNRGIASKWAQRTDCQPGYVVKDCKQYKG